MTESLSTVSTAQITYAARNSDFDGFDIKAGDYLALMEGKLFGTDGNLDTLLENLAASAREKEASFISLYFGEDVSEEDAQKAAAVFEQTCPEAEVAVLSGGQPVYYYIISMESGFWAAADAAARFFERRRVPCLFGSYLSWLWSPVSSGIL